MPTHISQVTKQLSADGIEAKLIFLREWTSNGIPWKSNDAGALLRDENGECSLDYFPTNIASFCSWDGSQNTGTTRLSLSSIGTTNRSTLYRSHTTVMTEIDDIFKALVAQANKQLKQANKTKFIGELNVELLFLRKLVSTQENEITAAALHTNRLENELLRANRALASLRERYDNETQQLRTRVAELTATLQKLMPLRIEE